MSRVVDIVDEMVAKVDAAVTGKTFAGEPLIVQVVRGRVPNPTPPTIDIYTGNPFRGEASASFGGDRGELFFTVRVRVDTADQTAGYELLLEFMDDESDLSVAMALFDDQTLNGRAGSVKVEGPSGEDYLADWNSTQAFLGCLFAVTVLNWST